MFQGSRRFRESRKSELGHAGSQKSKDRNNQQVNVDHQSKLIQFRNGYGIDSSPFSEYQFILNSRHLSTKSGTIKHFDSYNYLFYKMLL